jgi:membrane dipeptidase
MPLIFDAHLDLAWNAVSFDRDLTLPLVDMRQNEAHMIDEPGRGHCTVCYPEMQTAGVAICLATLLARGGPVPSPVPIRQRTDLDYAGAAGAHAAAHAQLAYYRLMERKGWLRIIETAADIDEHWQEWQTGAQPPPLGVILSMEGCDPMTEPEEAASWNAAGLRAAGFAHYGPGQYAGGTGTNTPLTDKGRRLLGEFERLGLALDVTHLSDESFEETLDLFAGPLLASHHNCRKLVSGQRQLTDDQIRSLLERDAVIGIALDAWMLYEGWIREETSPEVVGLEAAADHVDHICQIAGNAMHVGIGTDLDGGFGYEQTPRDVQSIADVQQLADILSERGYSDESIADIFHGNWLRFFRQVLVSAEVKPS